MTTYFIEATYFVLTQTKITFPDNRTWDDVMDWYVKWDTLYVQWKDTEEWDAFTLSSDHEIVDWKRPEFVSVFPVKKDGSVDYDSEVDSFEK